MTIYRNCNEFRLELFEKGFFKNTNPEHLFCKNVLDVTSLRHLTRLRSSNASLKMDRILGNRKYCGKVEEYSYVADIE